MSEPFLGEIRIVGFPYAPRGYAQCQGQRMPIAQNAALFSLLGVCYGGDGQNDFALPDLRGRMPIGIGQAKGRTRIQPGDTVETGARPDTPLTDALQGLGLNFVIAVEGTFPSR